MAALVKVNKDGNCWGGFSVSDEQFSHETEEGKELDGFHKTCLTKRSVCPICTKDIDSGSLLSRIQQMMAQPGRVFIRAAYATSFTILATIIGATAGATAGGIAGGLTGVTAGATKSLAGASDLKELTEFAGFGLLAGSVVGLYTGLVFTAASATTFSGEVAEVAEEIGPRVVVRAAVALGLDIGVSAGGVCGGGLASIPFILGGMGALIGK